MPNKRFIAWIIFNLSKIMPMQAFVILGKMISIFFYCCGIKTKAIVKSNMRKIKLKFSIKLYMNFAQFLCENIYLLHNDIDVRKFRILNRHILDNALSEGKGAVVISTHFGNWEFAGQYLRFIGYPVNVIYEKRDEWIYKYLDQIRVKYGIKLIDRNSSLAQFKSILDQNQLLGILIDHKSNNIQLKPMEFLGIKRQMPIGWYRLLKKTQAKPVLMYTFYRDGRHNIYFHDGSNMKYEEYYEFFREKIKNEIFQYDFFNRIWQDAD